MNNWKQSFWTQPEVSQNLMEQMKGRPWIGVCLFVLDVQLLAKEPPSEYLIWFLQIKVTSIFLMNTTHCIRHLLQIIFEAGALPSHTLQVAMDCFRFRNIAFRYLVFRFLLDIRYCLRVSSFDLISERKKSSCWNRTFPFETAAIPILIPPSSIPTVTGWTYLTELLQSHAWIVRPYIPNLKAWVLRPSL